MKHKFFLALLASTLIGSFLQKAAFSQRERLEPMRLWWSAARSDNATVGDDTTFPYGAEMRWEAWLPINGYGRAGVEFCAIALDHRHGFDPNQIIVLELWVSDERNDFMTLTGTPARNAAIEAGYRDNGKQGYIFREQLPGTVPVDLYWSSSRLEHYTLATDRGRRAAEEAGYGYAGTMGYAYPYQDCD